MRPLFSIILPTFNREKVLGRSISSIINQTYSEWELIIIDNMSIDSTSEIVKNFKDSRIKYFSISNNGLIAKSRNFGISKSSGEFIAFIDSDDWWKKDKLKNCLECIKDGKKFLYHNGYINKDYLFFSKKIKFFRKVNYPVYEDLINNGPAFPMSSVVIQKKLFSKINFFKEDKFSNWDDFDAWLRLSKIFNDFYCIDKALVNIGIDKNNGLTPQVQIDMIEDMKQIYFKAKNENNVNLPNWCCFAMTIALFRKKNYKKAQVFLNEIKFDKLTFQNKIKVFVLKIFLKLKK